MAKEIFIDSEKFKAGYYALEDTTKAPFGSARIMKNVQVTDRGGIAPRLGTRLLGNTLDTSAHPTDGFYNYRKSFDEEEILVRVFNGRKEGYSKNLGSEDWFLINDGYTPGKDWGFVNSLVNTDNDDYLVGNNRYEPFERWSGALTKVKTTATGSPLTTIEVDDTLTNEIFETGTATSNSTTTVDVSGTPWAASQFVGMYVYFPGTGVISKITANTSSQLTFNAISAPGNVAFEIRKLKFPASGNILINGTRIAYSAIPTATSFTVSYSGTVTAGDVVSVDVTTYPQNPRGNRLANYLGRLMVARVRSALARDSGGALQGFSSGGSYYVSKINNPVDFGFSATRVAGEGDIVGAPYGGGEFSDIIAQESQVYAFKPEYIEAAEYSQDSEDVIKRTPLKPGYGSVGRVIRGSDDVYFITRDKKFTSLGRVSSKDTTPQTENIGSSVKRLLDTMDFTQINGAEEQDKLLINGKSEGATVNDQVVVYNKINKSYDGIWDIGAFGFSRWNNKFLYAESTGPNVYEMFTGHADVVGTKRYGIAARYASHFMNLTPSKATTQALSSLYFEGYIAGNSVIRFQAWKDFSADPFLQFDFGGDETALLDGQISSAFLGNEPLALNPLGSIDPADAEGRRHFQFRVYFPFQYANFFSIGWSSSGVDYDWEVTRYGMNLREDVSIKASRVKTV